VFYSSLNLSEKYKLYVSYTPDGKETELAFTFGTAPDDKGNGSDNIKYEIRNFIFGVVILLLF
jgi:hypothetical protein